MEKIFKNPTVFSVLGMILIVLGLPIGLHGMTAGGGGALGGVITLFVVFIVSLIVILDRIIVKKVKRRIVNGVELALLVLGMLALSFNARGVIIDLREKETDFFILLENDGTLENSELNYSFPFHQKIEFEGNIGIINSIAAIKQRIDLKSPHSWDSNRMQPWSTNDFKLRFYSNGGLRFTDNEIDSIIREEIKTVVNNDSN